MYSLVGYNHIITQNIKAQRALLIRSDLNKITPEVDLMLNFLRIKFKAVTDFPVNFKLFLDIRVSWKTETVICGDFNL